MVIKDLNGGEPPEVPTIREALDQALAAQVRGSCHTVANTIFPSEMWNPELGRGELFERYLGHCPVCGSIKEIEMDCILNGSFPSARAIDLEMASINWIMSSGRGMPEIPAGLHFKHLCLIHIGTILTNANGDFPV